MHWTHGVEAGIQRAMAVALSLQMVCAVALGPSGVAGWAAVGLVVISAMRLALVRGRWTDHVGLAIALALSLLTVDERAAAASVMTPQFFVLMSAVSVWASLLRPRRAAAVVVAASTVYVALAAPGRLESTAYDVLGVVGIGLGGGALCHVMRGLARRSDEELDLSSARESHRLATEAAEQSRVETLRLIHDHLIADLATIARRPGAHIAELAARDGTDSLDEFHEDDSRERPLPMVPPSATVRVAVEDVRDGSQVPVSVWNAFVDATGEALRNVARHAKTDSARIRLEGDNHRLCVTVKDSGLGFSPGATVGFGLRSSIEERLAEDGATATTTSSPGAGTTVTMTWEVAPAPTMREDDRWTAMRSAVGDMTPLLAVYPLAHAAIHLVYVFGHLDIGGPAYLTLGIAAAVASCLLVALAARRPPGLVLVGSCLVVPPLAVAGGLWLAGPGALLGYGSWIVGFADVPVIVLALIGLRRSAFVAAGLVAVTVFFAALLDPSISPFDVFVPTFQALTHAAFFSFISWAVLRVDVAARRAHQSGLRSYFADRRSAARSVRLQETLDSLEPRVRRLLEDVVDGAVPAEDEAVIAEANLLALALRDELVAPGLLTTTSRSAVERLRIAGSTVHFRAEIPAGGRAVLSSLLAELAASDVARRYVVSSPSGEDTRIAVTCVPPLAAVADPRWRVIVDEEVTRLTAELP